MKYALIAIVTLIIACNKNETEAPQVSIAIEKPYNNQYFDEGDTVFMLARISSTTTLHDFRMRVMSATNARIWYDYIGHAHEKEMELNQLFIPTVVQDEQLLLEVISLNHKGELVKESVPFFVRNTIAEIPPSIQLRSPTASSHLHAGDLLQIVGEVTHDTLLQNITIELSIDDEQLLFETLQIVDATHSSFNKEITLPTNRFGFYRVRIVATDVLGISNTTIMHLSIHK
jgi:hypothetical protein